MVSVASTPAQHQMDAGKLKVIVVYGSESGTTKRGIDRWVKKWDKRDGRNFEIGEVVTGNALVKRLRTGDGNAQATNLEFLSQQYDVVLVATSSYGDGDPPSNIREFVKVLAHEASMGSDGLKGMQHAVLGFGSTTYTTFQNVPRLTDKFLGECGSRRLAQRAEIDEHDPNTGEEAAYKQWGEDVFNALQSAPAAASPPVCPWTEPNSKVANLNEDNEVDTERHPLGVPTIYVVTLIPLLLAVAAHVYLTPTE